MSEGTIENKPVLVPRKASTTAKAGVITSGASIIIAVWAIAMQFMSAAGVKPETTQKIDGVVQYLKDHPEQIKTLDDNWAVIQALITKKSGVAADVAAPDLTDQIKALSDQLKSLQDQLKTVSDQLKAQTDMINKLSQPPSTPPPVIQQPPVPVNPPTGPPVIKTTWQGKPITDGIEAGRQFRIQSNVAGTWSRIPADSVDVDWEECGGDVLAVLRNDAVLTIIHASHGDSKPVVASTIVKCLKASQPPPVVNPPGPTPTPIPALSKKFTLTVVEDSKVLRTDITGGILANLSARTAIEKRGHTITQAVRNIDNGPAAQYVAKQGTTLPALAVMDNETKQFVQSVPLPSDFGLGFISTIGG